MAERECSNCKHWSMHTNIGTCNASYSETCDDSLCDLYEAAPQPAALCGSAEVVEAVRAWQRANAEYAEGYTVGRGRGIFKTCSAMLNLLRTATFRPESAVRAENERLKMDRVDTAATLTVRCLPSMEMNSDSVASMASEVADEMDRLRGELDALATLVNESAESHAEVYKARRELDEDAARALMELEVDRDNARANARVLAHSWKHDARPPERVVVESLAYPVIPERVHRPRRKGS